MKTVPTLLIMLAIASGTHVPLAADTVSSPITATGLLPAYDSSGEQIGEIFSQHLTSAVYQSMKEGGRELVLLNPGAAYSPIDEASALEYARSAGVRTVLIPTLKRTLRDKPQDNSPRMQVELRVIDTKTSATL